MCCLFLVQTKGWNSSFPIGLWLFRGARGDGAARGGCRGWRWWQGGGGRLICLHSVGEDLRHECVEPSINRGALQGRVCLFMQFVRLSSQIDSWSRSSPRGVTSPAPPSSPQPLRHLQQHHLPLSENPLLLCVGCK